MSGTPQPTGAIVTPSGSATVSTMPESGKQSGGSSLLVTASPLAGGKRKSRKISKKILKMLKKMGPSKVAKMIKKGGDGEEGDGSNIIQGGRRHRGSKKTRRHSRRRHH